MITATSPPKHVDVVTLNIYKFQELL